MSNMPKARSQKSLIAQFWVDLEQWHCPLFGLICKLHKTGRLFQHCTNNETLSIVNNTSVQKNQQSGFAWVIAFKETALWKGVGLAPGPAEDMYSGRVEAFGVLVAIMFLRYYIQCYRPNQLNETKVNCFCDNLGIITNVTKLQNTTIQWPNNATNDNQDVYLAIFNAVNYCAPLKVQFLHVLGHQDKDTKQKLTMIK